MILAASALAGPVGGESLLVRALKKQIELIRSDEVQIERKRNADLGLAYAQGRRGGDQTAQDSFGEAISSTWDVNTKSAQFLKQYQNSFGDMTDTEARDVWDYFVSRLQAISIQQTRGKDNFYLGRGSYPVANGDYTYSPIRFFWGYNHVPSYPEVKFWAGTGQPLWRLIPLSTYHSEWHELPSDTEKYSFPEEREQRAKEYRKESAKSTFADVAEGIAAKMNRLVYGPYNKEVDSMIYSANGRIPVGSELFAKHRKNLDEILDEGRKIMSEAVPEALSEYRRMVRSGVLSDSEAKALWKETIVARLDRAAFKPPYGGGRSNPRGIALDTILVGMLGDDGKVSVTKDRYANAYFDPLEKYLDSDGALRLTPDRVLEWAKTDQLPETMIDRAGCAVQALSHELRGNSGN
jgi:hypothetical protein